MNILILGAGKGSWQVRGLQLGKALGARVGRQASEADLQWADVVVCVKRWIADYAQQVHQAGKPLVWDALDFWIQPEDNWLTEAEARELLRRDLVRFMPAATIGATQSMAQACGGFYVPHHAWPGLDPVPITTSTALTVGYEGTRKYLGRWGFALQMECNRRGWSFVINPTDYRSIDIVVAFRDGEWDGWMCRQWKSGVKFVNALAAGRPIVAQSCEAAFELPTSSTLIQEPADLPTAFDQWASLDARAACLERSLERRDEFSLAAVAERYRAILRAVVAQRVAA